MKYSLMTNFENWIIVKNDFETPTNKFGYSIDFEKWSNEMRKLGQANAKAMITFQSELSVSVSP